MTPLEIEILMHYATRGGDYREADFSAPAVRAAIDAFHQREGLLRSGDGRRCYEPTERCMVFAEALTRVPLPQQVWVMPPADLGPSPAGRTSK